MHYNCLIGHAHAVPMLQTLWLSPDCRDSKYLTDSLPLMLLSILSEPEKRISGKDASELISAVNVISNHEEFAVLQQEKNLTAFMEALYKVCLRHGGDSPHALLS